MRKVIGIGETVLDIIFKNEQPIGAYPGGSTYNAIVSMGRSGVPATFISEAGNDRVGERVVAFLARMASMPTMLTCFQKANRPSLLRFLTRIMMPNICFIRIIHTINSTLSIPT